MKKVYDSLQLSFDGFPHYNPLLYATELEERFGIQFDSLPTCSSITKYMLPKTYDIYGSNRLGSVQASSNRKDGDNLYSRKLGGKRYEITDHLGNVHAVISDRKLFPQDTTVDGFQAEVLSRCDYWPFGMEINGRSDSSGYRYGFNSYERDDEVKGSGNSYDFGARIYDPRLGKFLSIDPKFKSYPYWSPYLFAGNNPIRFIDIYGEGPQDKVQAQYDRLTNAEKGVIFRPQASPQLTVVRAAYILTTLNKNKGLAEARTIEEFGGNGRNDESDAFRHALFNALNTQSFGKELAKELSDAHEAIDDPVELQNNKGEIEMDVHNNTVGQEIGESNSDASFESIASKVKGALISGKLKAFDNPRDNTKGLNPTKGTKLMKPMPKLKMSLPEVKQDNTKTVVGG